MGDGCDLASTLCKYDLKKGDLFVLGNGATSEAGKYLFRAANVTVWGYVGILFLCIEHC